jgi:DNA adenine methylase
MKDFATLSRNRLRGGRNEQANAWWSAVDELAGVSARLRGVVILSRPATDVIKSQDGKNTLFYCDPPYVHSTRTSTSAYQHEMSLDQHREMLDALLKVQGNVLISGYRCELYDEKLASWQRHDFTIDNKASVNRTRVIESVWVS